MTGNRPIVVTWQSPRGDYIDIGVAQERLLRPYGVWPKDSAGEEYCTVSRGAHCGTPTCTDEQIACLVRCQKLRSSRTTGRGIASARLHSLSYR